MAGERALGQGGRTRAQAQDKVARLAEGRRLELAEEALRYSAARERADLEAAKAERARAEARAGELLAAGYEVRLLIKGITRLRAYCICAIWRPLNSFAVTPGTSAS